MASLDEFFATLDLESLEKVNGWVIRREGNLVRMTLRARDGAKYTVLFVCNEYPTSAPSTKFVDATDDSRNLLAWPTGTAAFLEVVKPPPACFLCMPLTREGLAHHPDWRNGKNPWGPTKTLMDLFNYVQRLLNEDSYTGRCKP